MGIWKRIFGICGTPPPRDPHSWHLRDKKLVLELDRIPELQSPAGAVRLEGKDLPLRVLIVHGNDGSFHAYENRCTHMGRRIDPLPGKEQIRCCSVSKSTFDYDGRPVSGAAREPVRVFETRMADGNLIVDLTPAAGS